MTSNKTVTFNTTALIIGAGAHVPYDFPTAFTLTEKIKDLLRCQTSIPTFQHIREHHIQNETHRDKINICKLIRDLQILPDNKYHPPQSWSMEGAIVLALDNFIRAFAGSQVNSIDTFLAERTLSENPDSQSVKIGKLLIAYFIQKHERQTLIGLHKQNWIQYITHEFLRKPEFREEFFKNPPRIYTFNYDNFLEKSLYQHLVDFHRVDPVNAKTMVKGLNIVHVYGDIGSFENDETLDPVAFFKNATERIKVAGELSAPTSNAGEYTQQILSDLQKIKHVYFLGFKFDELNTRTLFLGEKHKELYKGVDFHATHVNLTERERLEILERASFYINFPNRNDCDCLNLIREHQQIFTFEKPREEIQARAIFNSQNSWMS